MVGFSNELLNTRKKKGWETQTTLDGCSNQLFEEHWFQEMVMMLKGRSYKGESLKEAEARTGL